jgi:hypothetical protein
MATKVNGAFTGGLLGAGAGVAVADDLALITLHALHLDTLPPDVVAAWSSSLTWGYGLILAALLAVASKFVSPYLVEKGDEKGSVSSVPGA